MNDTPRTNAILTSILDTSGHVGFINCPPAWVAWARELERELNAANAHIKRLEEVGDEMLNWLTDDGISMENLRLIANAWRKAKRVGTIRQTTGAKDRGSW